MHTLQTQSGLVDLVLARTPLEDTWIARSYRKYRVLKGLGLMAPLQPQLFSFRTEKVVATLELDARSCALRAVYKRNFDALVRLILTVGLLFKCPCLETNRADFFGDRPDGKVVPKFKQVKGLFSPIDRRNEHKSILSAQQRLGPDAEKYGEDENTANAHDRSEDAPIVGLTLEGQGNCLTKEVTA